MKTPILMAAAAALSFAGVAHAATPDKPNTTRNCFLSNDWQSWRGADANTIYQRVHAHDFYKLELSSGSPMVTDPANHLVSQVRVSPWLCGPLDFDLRISDGHISEPLIVKSVSKLTPEQVAEIPRKVLP
jgi:hypothetical protein